MLNDIYKCQFYNCMQNVANKHLICFTGSLLVYTNSWRCLLSVSVCNIVLALSSTCVADVKQGK